MKRGKEKKAALFITILVVSILVAGIAVRYWKERNAFKFYEHITDTVVTIDQTKVSLGEMSYYIAMVEQELQSMAIAYNPGNPEEFWNAHFKDMENSAFTSTYAKGIAEQLCVYDYIMEQEAQKKGFSLNEEQKEECRQTAVDFYYRLSYEATQNTGITVENLLPLVERNELVKVYVTAVADEIKQQEEHADVSGFNYDGEYYQTVIRTQYDVQFNAAVWEPVKLGTVTVNLVK